MVSGISLRWSSRSWDEGSEIAEAGRNSLLIWAIKRQRAGSQTENRQDIANYRVLLPAFAIKRMLSATGRCPVGTGTCNNHHGLFASWAGDLAFRLYPASGTASTTHKKSINLEWWCYICEVTLANRLKTSFPLPCPWRGCSVFPAAEESNHYIAQVILFKKDSYVTKKHTDFLLMFWVLASINWTEYESESCDLLLWELLQPRTAAASPKYVLVRHAVYSFLSQLFYLKCYLSSYISFSHFCALLSSLLFSYLKEKP